MSVEHKLDLGFCFWSFSLAKKPLNCAELLSKKLSSLLFTNFDPAAN